ncbi:hypothetical protein [Massilibacteroides vaginae]|uniref:hypothetical protein n=1 Tax=Massilibacteroides vaginae TaxID=1673718 RepID=UPI00111C2ADA|nr:hypothetical protein [Massilibacteroides vaginae]
MKSSLFVSLLSLLLCVSACAPGIRSGYKRAEQTTIRKSELPPMIPESSELRKFHMEITFGKRNFSGLLLLRQQADSSRILFTTHFGLTIFDLAMDKNSYEIRQCIPPLHKKQLFNLLHRDLTVLFGQQLADQNKAIVYENNKKQNTIVYKLKNTEAKGHYRKQLSTNTVDKITFGSILGKTDISLQQTSQSETDSIVVSHPLLKLRFSITAF